MWEKLRNFLNDSDNELIIRLILVLIGIIFGTLLILLSTVVKNQGAIIAFQVFGYTTFFSFLIGVAAWYLIDN